MIAVTAWSLTMSVRLATGDQNETLLAIVKAGGLYGKLSSSMRSRWTVLMRVSCRSWMEMLFSLFTTGRTGR